MYAFGVDPFRKINQDLNLSSKSTEWHIPQGIQATGSPLLEAALCQPLHSLADSDQRALNIKYSFQITCSAGPSCPTPRARGIRKPLHFCQAESFYSLQHLQKSTLFLLQDLSSAWVTTPSSVTQNRCPPALGASGRNPPGDDCHRTGFFFSSEMLQLSLSTLQAGEVLVRCLPAGMQPGMQHLGSPLLCISSITFSKTQAWPPKSQ